MRRRAGITYVETLIAMSIVLVTITGTVSIFFSAQTLTSQTTTQATAVSLARRAIEEAKNQGFINLSEGTTTKYYASNGSGGQTTATTSSVYSVTTTVSTDVLSGGSPTQTSLRTVTVTVSQYPAGTVLETTGTYLAWGGP